MSKLDKEHLKNVCKLGRGAVTCSYLGMGTEGAECLKSTSFQRIINQRRAEKSIRAIGDNCSGPPNFKPTKETVN